MKQLKDIIGRCPDCHKNLSRKDECAFEIGGDRIWCLDCYLAKVEAQDEAKLERGPAHPGKDGK